MGWWDSYTDFASALDNQMYFIKHQLEGWAKNIADVAVSHANNWYNILNHSWDEVKDYSVTAAAVAVEMVQGKIDDARSYAEYKADQAYRNAVDKITLVYSTVSSMKSELNNNINSLQSQIYSLSSTVGNINIPGASTVRSWLSGDFANVKNIAKNYTDSTKSILLASMSSMQNVAGAARVALERELTQAINVAKIEGMNARNTIVRNLERSIDLLENATKQARNTLESKLNTAITVVETSAVRARKLLEKNLNAAMDVLERESKQAREVIEGTLIQMIEYAEDAFERALADLERTFDALLKALTSRVGIVEDWIGKASKWFDTEINKYKGRVIGWIVDGFEGILDRVFK